MPKKIIRKDKNLSISEYNNSQARNAKKICVSLNQILNENLKKSESKIWHRSPVWFLDENPVVAYYVRKDGRVSLMFFSGQSFDEKGLKPEGKFKAAEIFYQDVSEISAAQLKRWLKKAREIQWDYKNIVKNKGLLKRIV